MTRTPMTPAELTALNATDALNSPEQVHDRAITMGLELVAVYDESGALYRNDVGHYCFGWMTEEFGFDEQVDDGY